MGRSFSGANRSARAGLLLSFSVLPVGRKYGAIDLDAGLLFSLRSARRRIGGFHGGMVQAGTIPAARGDAGDAQMISYEVPLVLSTIPVVMLMGTLSLATIVNQQAQFVHGIAPGTSSHPGDLPARIVPRLRRPLNRTGHRADIPEAVSEIIAAI